MPTRPIVVYHVAAMGNWQEVVREQLSLLRTEGFTEVRVTHVGHGLDWLLNETARQDIIATVVQSDPNTDHYETFAMIEIDRLAKIEQVTRPIMYLHTKGVSAPHDHSKRLWRWAMGHHVVTKWQENVGILSAGYDAVGMNWWQHGEQHFSGTFWIANPNWIRRLPDFIEYHNDKGRVRYSCEMWIGAAQYCRAYSHACNDQVVWDGHFDFGQILQPPPRPPESITWVTCVTPNYLGDLAALQASVGLLGPGHRFIAHVVEPCDWVHTMKLAILRLTLPAVATTHVFWIDADCEFLTTLPPSDFLHPLKPLTAVRHFASTGPLWNLPDRLKSRVTHPDDPVSWQACLFGGRVVAVAELLNDLRWMDREGITYDEHGIVIELDRQRDRVLTLPCRYAAPHDFQPFPHAHASYEERSGGAARILHRNREIRR